jgi:hypothetical protein
MAVAIDAQTNGTGTANTTITVAHTTGIAAGIIVVLVATRGAAGTPTTGMTATYGAVSLDTIGTKTNTSSEEKIDIFAGEWPSIGANNLVLNWTSTASVQLAIFTLTGAAIPLASSFQSQNGNSNLSITITSATNDLCFDVTCVDRSGSAEITCGQTQKLNQENLATGYEQVIGVSTKAGAASVNMTWANVNSRQNAYGGINVPAGFPRPRGNPAAISPYLMI